MEQLGSHWTDFHEIWYLYIIRKYILKIQVSFKSEKNKAYFIWRPMYIYDTISLISSCNADASCTENRDTQFVFTDAFPEKWGRLWDSM